VNFARLQQNSTIVDNGTKQSWKGPFQRQLTSKITHSIL